MLFIITNWDHTGNKVTYMKKSRKTGKSKVTGKNNHGKIHRKQRYKTLLFKLSVESLLVFHISTGKRTHLTHFYC